MIAVAIGYSEESFAKLGSDRWSKIWWRRQHGMEPTGIRMPENKLLDRFLAREFTRRVARGEEWMYKLSIAISDIFLKARPASAEGIAGLHSSGVTRVGEVVTGARAAGLVYPSIATGANDDNIALACESADECLELVWVQYIEITRTTNKLDEFTLRGWILPAAYPHQVK
jgi:hypothetical protein